MRKKIASFFLLVSSDIIVIFLSFLIAYFIRDRILPHVIHQFRILEPYPFSNYLDYFYMAIVWIFFFTYEKLYTKRFPFREEVKILMKSATLSSSFVMIVIFVARKQTQFSRTVVILAYTISLFLFPLFRYLTKYILVKTNLWKKKLIIAGVDSTSLLVLKNIIQNKTMGYEVVGFLDNDPKKIGKKFEGLKVLGRFSDLENIVKAFQSKDIMIVDPDMPREKFKQFLSKCENISESMWIIPRSGDFITEGVEVDVLGEIFTLSIKKNLAKPWNILIKTTFDVCLSFLLAIALFPILIFISIAIKIDSKGPIIFVQKRIGKKKKEFNLLKFRSMYMNSESKLVEYLDQNQEEKETWEKYRKLKTYDPRVTRVGRIIRKYSLDELPQLFNVLMGKMSLVGPRPYLSEELEANSSSINIISRVKPGITGLWQTRGRSEIPFEQRLALDEFYIRNWSLWLDITLLLKSFNVWFSGKGAY